MTLADLKRWAAQGFPVRVDGQDMFVQADSVGFEGGEPTRRDVISVAANPFNGPPRRRRLLDVPLASVEILTGKEAGRAVTKEKLS